MSAATFDTFLSEALTLPLEQRSRLATRLLASLEEDDSPGISPAWQAEAHRRARELDAGTVKPMSLEDFQSHIESRVET